MDGQLHWERKDLILIYPHWPGKWDLWINSRGPRKEFEDKPCTVFIILAPLGSNLGAQEVHSEVSWDDNCINEELQLIYTRNCGPLKVRDGREREFEILNSHMMFQKHVAVLKNSR